jgi:hypothetical protein
MQVTTFTEDTVLPALATAALDMTAQVLSLSFNEAINRGSFKHTDISLQGAAIADGSTESHKLSGGDVTIATDARSLDIVLTTPDFMKIAYLRDLASIDSLVTSIDSTNTFLTYASTMLVDLSDLSPDAIVAGVRCAVFRQGYVHPRMPLVPTHAPLEALARV